MISFVCKHEVLTDGCAICTKVAAGWARLAAEKKGKGPTLLAKAAGLVKAVAAHVASGMRRTPPEEYDARIAACLACDRRTGTDRSPGCSLCGCHMRHKAAMAEQSCPHPRGSRWPLPIPPMA